MGIVKFNKHIEEYRYVLSFDLAKFKTGFAMYDTVDDTFVKYGVICVSEKSTHPCYDLFKKIKDVLSECRSVADGGAIFVTKERLPNQAGRFSTISTLQALAEAHAALEIACEDEGADIYDEFGIHAISVKSYFRSIIGIEKPTKEDIAAEILKKYDLTGEYTLDTTDAIGVVFTLLNKRWDTDITDGIKELKKNMKTYKTQKKRDEVQSEIDRLNKLKNGGKKYGIV